MGVNSNTEITAFTEKKDLKKLRDLRVLRVKKGTNFGPEFQNKKSQWEQTE